MNISRALTLLVVCGLPVTGCETGPRADPPVVAEAPADSATRVVVADSALVAAAESIVAFLRGQGNFDPALFADSVTLHVAPGGGGQSRRVERAVLADRTAWTVLDRRLTPFAGNARLTTRVGRHLNCVEAPLTRLYPALARLPHVGTQLSPPGEESCLQGWSLTLVFSNEHETPVLVAAVYDQWEW